jgi:hypothetical protein
MPKIDVREAEPGPELDAACAEVYSGLIGWEREEHFAVIYYDAPDDSGRSIVVVKPDKIYVQDRGFWQPSTDISAAWELHNHVGDIGEFLTALISVINYDRDLLPEDFNIGEPGMDWVLVDEDVWALATATAHQRARAFLLAHGITKIEVQEA